MSLTRRPHILRRYAIALAVFLATMLVGRMEAQFSELLSPGPLAKAHAKLEGLSNCESCHEKGNRVAADRCLTCHKPIAERIVEKRGIHRDVEDDCIGCHVEHAGRDGELRPFDTSGFDHTGETGFSLSGRHEAIRTLCDKCHKTRSFITLTQECVSCHEDVHKGQLGTECLKCHPVALAFKSASKQFDHSLSAFALEGAHQRVPCAKCHQNKIYKGLQFKSCTSCHETPHPESFGRECQACHTAANWNVARFDHGKTGTPLVGMHRSVECGKCHVQPAMKVKLKPTPCASCHADPHKGEFRQDCGACHKETGFKGAPFDHATRTEFPLTGRHEPLRCAACHKDNEHPDVPDRSVRARLDFQGLKSACASCHADPHEGRLGVECVRCHTPVTFHVTKFTHPTKPEFFATGHASVTCDQCHSSREKVSDRTKVTPVAKRLYRDLSTECSTCHRDPHEGQLPRCERCHAVDSEQFKPTRFDHAEAEFKLTGKHTTVQCNACHKPELGRVAGSPASGRRFAGVPKDCDACHRDTHLGQLDSRCETCHSTESFTVDRYTHQKQPDLFRGRHGTAECQACHQSVEGDFPSGHGRAVRFVGVGAVCVSCHRSSFDETREPNHVAAGFPTSCESCHGSSFTTWRQGKVSHASFPLAGVHTTQPCANCHRNGVYQGTSRDCYSCHRSQYDQTRNPNHVTSGFPTSCEVCHRFTDTSWTRSRFNHSTFPLSGVHTTQSCEACHRNRSYQGTPRDCYSCHRTEYEQTRDPNHVTAGIPTSCESCHRFSDTNWGQGNFNHATFPLSGVHTTQSCEACHRNGVYQGTSRDCYSCHRSEYEQARDPNHVTAGMPTSCESCHKYTDTDWGQGTFNHATFPLTGVHTTQSCEACHRNGVYQGTSRDCYSCHRSEYEQARDPNHVTAGMPTSCESCHKYTDTDWSQGKFNHATFPLSGVHTTQSCEACHRNGVYQGTPRDCYSCHRTEYEQTRGPDHVTAGFPTSCESCHRFSDTNWGQGKFNHATFPLSGVHTTQSCEACHRNGVYQGTPRDCYSCHRTEYEQTRDPNHVTAGFPTSCDSCHRFSDTDWGQGNFNHATFPLSGVHTTQSCEACHRNGVYQGTPRDCYSCHRTEYEQTRDPNHVTAGFPTSCDSCHRFSDTDWGQGKFNHATFPLSGVHTTQSCEACHRNGVYQGTPRDCYSCHRTEYEQTRDPNHVTAGFPTSCDSCHRFSDTDWGQGKFNHATFPLSGVHTTQSCEACHRNGVYQGTPRDCYSCHRTEYEQTRDPNHVTAGFPTSCDSCHRFSDTDWGQGKFNHATFPLSGVHTTQSCEACHRNGVYQGTPRDCYSCHRTEYEQTRDPNHVTAGFPISCENCHRFADSSWTQGRFNHTWFPIASGRHSGNPCTACHQTPNYQVFTCLTCHTRGETDSEHRGRAGYRYDSIACYSCHPQGRSE